MNDLQQAINKAVEELNPRKTATVHLSPSVSASSSPSSSTSSSPVSIPMDNKYWEKTLKEMEKLYKEVFSGGVQSSKGQPGNIKSSNK